MLGGGIAGPCGEVDRARAGDPGEYHHSKNLIKNIAVGSNRRRESNRRRGELKRSCPRRDHNVRLISGDVFLPLAIFAALWKTSQQ